MDCHTSLAIVFFLEGIVSCWTVPRWRPPCANAALRMLSGSPTASSGAWDAALSATDGLSLIRVCREGEAFAVAAGLHLGGKKPIVLIQCTGLFEAGDALRNVLHDMRLPLFFVVGVRSYHLHQQKATADTCPARP